MLSVNASAEKDNSCIANIFMTYTKERFYDERIH